MVLFNIDSLQFPGKKKMECKELLNGINFSDKRNG